jgi:hypothetical protein
LEDLIFSLIQMIRLYPTGPHRDWCLPQKGCVEQRRQLRGGHGQIGEHLTFALSREIE